MLQFFLLPLVVVESALAKIKYESTLIRSFSYCGFCHDDHMSREMVVSDANGAIFTFLIDNLESAFCLWSLSGIWNDDDDACLIRCLEICHDRVFLDRLYRFYRLYRFFIGLAIVPDIPFCL